MMTKVRDDAGDHAPTYVVVVVVVVVVVDALPASLLFLSSLSRSLVPNLPDTDRCFYPASFSSAAG